MNANSYLYSTTQNDACAISAGLSVEQKRMATPIQNPTIEAAGGTLKHVQINGLGTVQQEIDKAKRTIYLKFDESVVTFAAVTNAITRLETRLREEGDAFWSAKKRAKPDVPPAPPTSRSPFQNWAFAFAAQLVADGPFPDFNRNNFTEPERQYPASQKLVRNPALWKQDERGRYYKDGPSIAYLSPPLVFRGQIAHRYPGDSINFSLFLTEKPAGVFYAEVTIIASIFIMEYPDDTGRKVFFDYLGDANRNLSLTAGIRRELSTPEGYIKSLSPNQQHFFREIPRHIYTDAGALLRDIVRMQYDNEADVVAVIKASKWEYERA